MTTPSFKNALAELDSVRFYTNEDVYYYTVDNRPLEDLDKNLKALASATDASRQATLLEALGNSAFQAALVGKGDKTAGLETEVAPGEVILNRGVFLKQLALREGTSQEVMKRAALASEKALATPAPSESGYETSYLIQIRYVDYGPGSDEYEDNLNPFFASSVLNGKLDVKVIEGSTALVGESVPPSAESGWLPLYRVVSAHGASPVVSDAAGRPEKFEDYIPALAQRVEDLEVDLTAYVDGEVSTVRTYASEAELAMQQARAYSESYQSAAEALSKFFASYQEAYEARCDIQDGAVILILSDETKGGRSTWYKAHTSGESASLVLDFSSEEYMITALEFLRYDSDLYLVDAPETLTSPGQLGEVAITEDSFYIVVQENLWRKVPLTFPQLLEDHEAASNPHPQYLLSSSAQSLYVPQIRTVASLSSNANLSAQNLGSYLRCSGSTSRTLTFLSDASTQWPIGGSVEIRNVGPGSLTLTPAAGVSLFPPAGGSLVLSAGQTVRAIKVAANQWDVIG